jgi:hypothetical protein
MTGELAFDLVEEKGDLLFVGGVALTSLAVGDRFTALYDYGDRPKQPRRCATLDLSIAALIVDGEPVASVTAQTSVLVALAGTATPIIAAVRDRRWQRKRQRYLRTTPHPLALRDA